MSILSTREMLLAAQKNRYAVPAFNIHNMETLQGILKGAEELKSPVIIATSPGTVEYAGVNFLVSMIKAANMDYNIPISLHLDHANDIGLIKKCIDAGYKSVMIDASLEDFNENIRITKEVVEYAHNRDVVVEAELGKLAGIEEDINISERDALLTNPDEAYKFVKETGIDSLAVSIGTAHGVYSFEPNLDIERLKKMNEIIEIPLVLHGASGVPEDQLKESIKNGICKVNISTELKIPYSDALREYLIDNPEETDVRNYMKPAMESITDIVKQKILICGSNNRIKE